MSLSPGTHLGVYEVLAKIGEGGMGQLGNGCLSRGTRGSGQVPLSKA